MDCDWITRDDIFEQYVRDALGSDERDAFEAHYFACAACLDKIHTYQALRAELAWSVVIARASRGRVRIRRWAAIHAAAVLLLAAAAWMWLKPVPGGMSRSFTTAATATGQGPSSAPLTATGPSSGSTAFEREPAARPLVALSVLARVEPPVYIPAALRGPTSDAAEKFRAAMARYAAGDYASAISDLRAAVILKPDVAQYTFFLAICQLLVDQIDSAIVGLRQTIALGNSPYLEEAHFYLAKARLRRDDVPAARCELQRTIERHGRLEETARTLLANLDAMAGRFYPRPFLRQPPAPLDQATSHVLAAVAPATRGGREAPVSVPRYEGTRNTR